MFQLVLQVMFQLILEVRFWMYFIHLKRLWMYSLKLLVCLWGCCIRGFIVSEGVLLLHPGSSVVRSICCSAIYMLADSVSHLVMYFIRDPSRFGRKSQSTVLLRTGSSTVQSGGSSDFGQTFLGGSAHQTRENPDITRLGRRWGGWGDL